VRWEILSTRSFLAQEVLPHSNKPFNDSPKRIYLVHDKKPMSRTTGLIVNTLTFRRNHSRLLMRIASRCVAKDAAETHAMKILTLHYHMWHQGKLLRHLAIMLCWLFCDKSYLQLIPLIYQGSNKIGNKGNWKWLEKLRKNRGFCAKFFAKLKLLALICASTQF